MKIKVSSHLSIHLHVLKFPKCVELKVRFLSSYRRWTLLKCQEVLESFQSLENNCEKRVDSLNENWESSRELIFKSILCTQGLHMLGQLCAICAEGKCDVRCIECGGKKMCGECDVMIHQDLFFHDRGSFCGWFQQSHTSYCQCEWRWEASAD